MEPQLLYSSRRIWFAGITSRTMECYHMHYVFLETPSVAKRANPRVGSTVGPGSTISMHGALSPLLQFRHRSRRCGHDLSRRQLAVNRLGRAELARGRRHEHAQTKYRESYPLSNAGIGRGCSRGEAVVNTPSLRYAFSASAILVARICFAVLNTSYEDHTTRTNNTLAISNLLRPPSIPYVHKGL